MELTINKIGKIKKAEINVNGLTLIAGKNDTGKSTVGKILYASIKAFNGYIEYYNKKQINKLKQNYLLPLLQGYISRIKDKELVSYIADVIDYIRDDIFYDGKIKKLKEEDIIGLLGKIKKESDVLPSDLLQYISKIEAELRNIDITSDEKKFLSKFDNRMKIIFANTINNSKYKEDGNINISNQNCSILDSAVVNNEAVVRTVDLERSKSLYGNVVYVETPFVLEGVMSRKVYWYELWPKFSKWPTSDKIAEYAAINEDLLAFIQSNIFKKANIILDSADNDIFYQVDEGASKLDLSNVACGIKSFALLLLLFKLNILSKDVLLIVDEPENHLHPEFQIKYADLICLLVSKGFSVVLTSHSPTFIQALGAYSNKYKIKNKTSFYLAEQVPGENYSIITDKTENLNDIYRDLVYPVERLFAGE